ncbi:hypothetical protein WJ24_11920 [Burkholderia vietnamiensis]|nr:hypothetical protein WJ24_11920 [Burkholderia vietnamiensis]
MIRESAVKILHVIPSADPTSGGPIEFVTRLSAQLSIDGHSIHLVTLDDQSVMTNSNHFASVTQLGRGFGGYRCNLRLVHWLYQNARSFDAVVIDGLWQFHGAAALIALGLRGVRYHVFSHGMLDPWFKRTYPLKHIKKLAYWCLIERHLLKRAASVIFTCEAERLLARESFPFYEVNEVISVLGTARPPEVAVPKNATGIRSTAKKIVFLSRIHEKKGCDLLLEAFANLASIHPEYELVIAGPGEASLVRRLKERAHRLQIADRVTWCGMVSGMEKWSLLRSADVFCLPSHQENFGIAVIEALACGIPTLITNKVNIWHEIVESGAGIADDDSVEGVLTMLSKWASLSDGERDAMRKAASLCFETKFHIERASENYMSILALKKNDRFHVEKYSN